MKELVKKIAIALVDHPEAVRVHVLQANGVTVFQLSTHPADLGKVIGRDGRMAKAIRVLLESFGARSQQRFALEIVPEFADPGATK